jgi:hypothetical protein
MDRRMLIGVICGVVAGASLATVNAQSDEPQNAGRYAVAAAAANDGKTTHAYIVDSSNGTLTYCSYTGVGPPDCGSRRIDYL